MKFEINDVVLDSKTFRLICVEIEIFFLLIRISLSYFYCDCLPRQNINILNICFRAFRLSILGDFPASRPISAVFLRVLILFYTCS